VNNTWVDLHALWKIIVVGLICGAGLPALFAIGLRALSIPRAGQPATAAGEDRIIGGNPVGMAAATVCFAVVLAAIGWGIYIIVAGT
jgi:hypothetical protein